MARLSTSRVFFVSISRWALAPVLDECREPGLAPNGYWFVSLSPAAVCEYTHASFRVVCPLENTFEQLEAEMSVKQVSMSIGGFAMFSTFVNAHSGHGDPNNSSGIVHYMTSPVHVLPVLLAAVLVTAIAVSAVRNRRLSAAKVRR